MIKKDKGVMEDKKLTMPMIALRGLTVLPQMTVNFDIIRDKSIAAVEQAMVGDQRVFLATQKQPDEVIPDIDGIFQVGTIGYVKQLVKMPGGMVRVTVEGQERAELLEMEKGGACCTAIVEILDPVEDDLDTIQKEAMLRILKEKLEEYGKLNVAAGREVLSPLIAQPDLTELMNQISAQFPWNYEARQSVLECRTLTEMYETELQLLLTELEVYRVKREFQTKVKAALDKNQRDYILREQLRVIREELGEENPVSDADEMKEQLKKIKASVEVKERIRKEINRFQNMPAGSQDANVIRTYLETVLELPWNKMTKDNASLKHAEEILEADHYGLEKVKERVLEYLAVRILTKKGTSPILCLVGPPGTGKTSIARSIAKAMGRKYVRISLGGVRDEAEIRGHRKTYVGAMPGRIVEGLKQAGVANPLMLLDEIDKVSSDYKGDTSSALLEVLDSEQNVKFRDHYVEIPIDLSEVLFIATANTTQTIPGPLLDRMELIEVNSYTENEKYHIAKDYLIPKQLEKNGLSKEQLNITGSALEKMIHSYTREAGVRNLERRVGDICRKAAREVLEKKKTSIRVTERNLDHYLGREKVFFDAAGNVWRGRASVAIHCRSRSMSCRAKACCR
ncbi:endopeptidase La [Clostridium sp.]|uniref:endopeptidase La n=2 Tax=Clostridium sp. TaxID=1506 RepID=UPI00307738BC